jgi:hypothetical protein
VHLIGPGAPRSRDNGVPIFQIRVNQVARFRERTSVGVTVVELAVVRSGVQAAASGHDNLTPGYPGVLDTARRAGSAETVTLSYRPRHIGRYTLLERIEYRPPPVPCGGRGTATAESIAAYLNVVG